MLRRGRRKDFFVREMTEILGEKFFYGGVASGAEKKMAATGGKRFFFSRRL